eukprot:jgi/Mesvir1/26803/Mv20568-RA.1
MENLELFQVLDEYLMKEKPLLLRVLFDEYDQDQSGYLNCTELGHLVKRIMPNLTERQVRYFQTMVDIDGDGRVTFEELRKKMKEARITANSIRADQPRELWEAMSKLHKFITENKVKVSEAFAHYDINKRGKLSFSDSLRMFQSLLPAITRTELRYVVTAIDSIDSDHDGFISESELRTAIEQHSQGAADDAAPAEDPKSLLLFQNLEKFLMTEQPHLLRVLFGEFDKDFNGYLNKQELGGLLRRLMPHVSDQEVRFFQIMVDVNNDNRVTFQELRQAMKESRMASMAVLAEDHADVRDVMTSLLRFIKENDMKVSQAFNRYDTNGDGAIDYAELLTLFRGFIPGLSARDLRFLASAFDVIDADGDGAVSLEELTMALEDYAYSPDGAEEGVGGEDAVQDSAPEEDNYADDTFEEGGDEDDASVEKVAAATAVTALTPPRGAASVPRSAGASPGGVGASPAKVAASPTCVAAPAAVEQPRVAAPAMSVAAAAAAAAAAVQPAASPAKSTGAAPHGASTLDTSIDESSPVYLFEPPAPSATSPAPATTPARAPATHVSTPGAPWLAPSSSSKPAGEGTGAAAPAPRGPGLLSTVGSHPVVKQVVHVACQYNWKRLAVVAVAGAGICWRAYVKASKGEEVVIFGEKYKVREGDNLTAIARKTGQGSCSWQDLVRLNNAEIQNPSIILPGQTLELCPKKKAATE